MHIAKTAKVIFLLANHLVAAHAPPRVIIPSYRVNEAPDAGIVDILKHRGIVAYSSSLGLVSRQDGASCDRRAKCKKNKIRNPADNTKCIRCPPLTKPDPSKTICVKDNDANNDDRRKQFEERIKEMIKEKYNQFKEKVKDRIAEKKVEKQKEWEEKDKKRKDERNQKKFRRMAICSPAVAASIGTVAMLELADGGFSEDLFDSINLDMLEFWPSNDIDDDWLDKSLPNDESDITKEDYVAAFLEVGDAASGNAKRSINKRNSDGNGQVISESPEPPVEKRNNIISAIVAAFRNLIVIISAVARSRAGSAGTVARVTRFFSDGKKPNLKKPGESKLSHAQQKEKAKEIAQNKNWRRCLRGEKPEK